MRCQRVEFTAEPPVFFRIKSNVRAGACVISLCVVSRECGGRPVAGEFVVPHAPDGVSGSPRVVGEIVERGGFRFELRFESSSNLPVDGTDARPDELFVGNISRYRVAERVPIAGRFFGHDELEVASGVECCPNAVLVQSQNGGQQRQPKPLADECGAHQNDSFGTAQTPNAIQQYHGEHIGGGHPIRIEPRALERYGEVPLPQGPSQSSPASDRIPGRDKERARAFAASGSSFPRYVWKAPAYIGGIGLAPIAVACDLHIILT